MKMVNYGYLGESAQIKFINELYARSDNPGMPREAIFVEAPEAVVEFPNGVQYTTTMGFLICNREQAYDLVKNARPALPEPWLAPLQDILLDLYAAFEDWYVTQHTWEDNIFVFPDYGIIDTSGHLWLLAKPKEDKHE